MLSRVLGRHLKWTALNKRGRSRGRGRLAVSSPLTPPQRGTRVSDTEMGSHGVPVKRAMEDNRHGTLSRSYFALSFGRAAALVASRFFIPTRS